MSRSLLARGLVGTTTRTSARRRTPIGLIDHLDPEVDDLLEPPLPRALPRVHGRRVRAAVRGDGEGAGSMWRQGRQSAPLQGQLLLERRSREHRAGGHWDRARREAEGVGCGLDGVPRRRHARRRRDVRVAEHRVALAAPVLFVVENNHYAQSTPVELELAGSIAARGAAFGVEVDELDTTDVEVIHERAGAAVARIRETGAPFFLVLNTYRFSPHSVGRSARPGRDRGAPHADLCSLRARDSTTTSARRSRRGVKSASPRPSRLPMPRRPRRPESLREYRRPEARRPGPQRDAAHDLRRARRRRPLRRGRARSVRRVQGDGRPERRVSRPRARRRSARRRSSASLREWRCADAPILEIMFGDFIALGLDQVVNGISKFRECTTIR